MITWIQIATVLLTPLFFWGSDRALAEDDFWLGHLLSVEDFRAARALRYRVLLWHPGQLILVCLGLLLLAALLVLLFLPWSVWLDGEIGHNDELAGRVLFSVMSATPLGLAFGAVLTVPYSAWYWFRWRSALRWAEIEERDLELDQRERLLKLERARLRLLRGRLGTHRVPALPTRANDELRSALTHIAYEFVALERAVEQFQKTNTEGGQRRFDLEAALVHVRNLTEFFWAPTRKRRLHPDGVYAAHYLPTMVSWRTIRDSLPQFPSQSYDAVCAQLAHISVSRTTLDGAMDFAADIAALNRDLSVAWHRWRAELQSTPWSGTLDEAVSAWREAG